MSSTVVEYFLPLIARITYNHAKMKNKKQSKVKMVDTRIWRSRKQMFFIENFIFQLQLIFDYHQGLSFWGETKEVYLTEIMNF